MLGDRPTIRLKISRPTRRIFPLRIRHISALAKQPLASVATFKSAATMVSPIAIGRNRYSRNVMLADERSLDDDQYQDIACRHDPWRGSARCRSHCAGRPYLARGKSGSRADANTIRCDEFIYRSGKPF